MAMKRDELTSGTNPLAEVDDGLSQGHQRKSSELIYESVMRGGGEPFGRPFEYGIGSLTDRIVRLLNVKSFFGFETLERPRRSRRNKFTRYGSANFRGRYGKK